MGAGKDDGFLAQIEGALRSATWIGQVPALYWLHDFLSPIIGNHLDITARHGGLRTFAAQEIANRKDRGSDHQDILDKLFEVQKEKPKDMDDANVLSMATSNIFAGSDTTAISTRSIIHYLLKNLECKKKLVEKIDTEKREGKLSESITLEQTKQMPYLQACLYEGLRCHPAIGMSLPRVTPHGGIEIDGRYLPEGVSAVAIVDTLSLIVFWTVIGVNPWAVHRDTKVFREDAEQFRPERWLEKDDNGDMGIARCCMLVGSLANMPLLQSVISLLLAPDLVSV